MTAEILAHRAQRARANFDSLLAYKKLGEQRGIPAVIREIWGERQWLDLGFGSYGDACANILGPDWRIPWPVEERRAVVAELSVDGMSTRAIAGVVGVSQSTVRDDVAQVSSSTHLPATTGLDGKTYQRPPRPEDDTPRPHRRPLPDAFFATSHDLGRTAKTLHNLTTDDRWPRNAEQVARYRNDLLRTRDLIDQVIAVMPNNPPEG